MSKILLIAYNNGSYVNTFPLGLGYIASALLKEKHDVEIYNQDIYHYPNSHLTNYLNKNHFDFVGIGVIAGYYQYQKLIDISDAINLSKRRNKFTYVIGGSGPSPEPQHFLNISCADFVIRGEGEQTFVELIRAFNNNKKSIEDVKGICYFDGDDFVENEPRKLLDIEKIEMPAWDLFPMEHYALVREPGFENTDRAMTMISGRGCPFSCKFCSKSIHGFRPRSTESIVKEIKLLQKKYKITAVEFQDELLMCNMPRTIEICSALKSLNIKWWCNGRLNHAQHQSLLTLMRDSGCCFINYGIEALDNDVLKNMNKNLTVEQIIRGVENTYQAGIKMGLNFMWGNIGDTKKTLKEAVKFIKKYNDGYQLRTIRPMTPYPGSPYYYQAIKEGKLGGVEDFYINKHLNSDLLSVNFTKYSDKKFHKYLKCANTQLIKDYYNKNKNICLEQCKDLYRNKNVNFRGFRSI